MQEKLSSMRPSGTWRSWGTPATFQRRPPHRDSRRAGGVSLHARLHYCPVELVSSAIPPPGGELPRDWVVVAVPMEKTELIVVSLYLTDGLGLGGINVQ